MSQVDSCAVLSKCWHRLWISLRLLKINTSLLFRTNVFHTRKTMHRQVAAILAACIYPQCWQKSGVEGRRGKLEGWQRERKDRERMGREPQLVYIVASLGQNTWYLPNFSVWGLLYPPLTQSDPNLAWKVYRWCTMPCHISPSSVNTVVPNGLKRQILQISRGSCTHPPWPISVKFCVLEYIHGLCLHAKFHLILYIMST